MAEKDNSEHVEERSGQQSPRTPTEDEKGANLHSADFAVDANAPRRRYAFGYQGKVLMRTISACGAIGFMLFGYDQGVLGVSISALILEMTQQLTT